MKDVTTKSWRRALKRGSTVGKSHLLEKGYPNLAKELKDHMVAFLIFSKLLNLPLDELLMTWACLVVEQLDMANQIDTEKSTIKDELLYDCCKSCAEYQPFCDGCDAWSAENTSRINTNEN